MTWGRVGRVVAESALPLQNRAEHYQQAASNEFCDFCGKEAGG